MDEFNERIVQLAEFYKVDKPSLFAKKTGFSHQVASNYLKGSSKPSVQALKVIQTTFENANSLWLLTGKGEMLLENNNPPTETLNDVQDNKFDISPEAEINRTEFKAAQENVEWYKNLVDKQQNTIDEGLALQKSMFAELQESKVRIEKLVEIINTYKNTEKGNDLV